MKKSKLSPRKIFLSSTKMSYGRPEILYLLNDLGRISNDHDLSNEYVSLLHKNTAAASAIIEWSFCLDSLAKQLEKESFDCAIGVGNLGRLIVEDLLARGVKMGESEVFYVTRLSNDKWEKVGYIHSPYQLPQSSLKEQVEKINKKIAKARKVAIVDDVTYSGGTRKVLANFFNKQCQFYAIDLVTLKSAIRKNQYYKKWYSSFVIKHDPYPTLNSRRQADVMNVSEYVYPSKYVGKIVKGRLDRNKILWNGQYKIFKRYAYTASHERNEVYFGGSADLVCRATKKLQKNLKIKFR
jgi:hypothetical protein